MLLFFLIFRKFVLILNFVYFRIFSLCTSGIISPGSMIVQGFFQSANPGFLRLWPKNGILPTWSSVLDSAWCLNVTLDAKKRQITGKIAANFQTYNQFSKISQKS